MNDLKIFKTLNENIDELYDLIDAKMTEGKFDELNAFFAFICRDIYMFDLGFPPPLQKSIAKKFNNRYVCLLVLLISCFKFV